MTTVAIITVLSPIILIVLVAVAGVLAVWLTLFIARYPARPRLPHTNDMGVNQA